ncbi:MAG: hypothetical protein OEY89_17550, partial [Gammaproteobacteria bacterium]|nr:hypothetical protein [Gammaproteobacteria bacterium]
YLEGVLLDISNKSADIEKNGKLYQVKARKLKKGTTTQLGVIRSWNFDYLVVIIFDIQGNVRKASIVPSVVAKEVSVENSHQNGYIITTNYNFFNSRIHTDITDEIKRLNGEEVLVQAEVIDIKSRRFYKLDRIEDWAKHPEQNNHRIIRAYLKLNQISNVTKKSLCEACSSSVDEPGLYVEKFSQNFNSMKTDAGNSHGKVFLEENDQVIIYPQAMSEIKKYFPHEYFINDWPFDKPEDHLVITLKEISNKETPILYVRHFKDDSDWLFIKLDEAVIEDYTTVPISTIIDIDPTVKEIANIPPGWHAWRESIDDEWEIECLEDN